VILFFTTDIENEADLAPEIMEWKTVSKHGEDYLQDLLLIGLRNICGKEVVDFPKKEVMYNTCEIPDEELYGRGFTVWKKLEDIEVDRTRIWERLDQGEFELVIFSSVWRQQNFLQKFQREGLWRKSKLVFIDGEDAGVQEKMSNEGLAIFGEYYKRESVRDDVLPISFSIPEKNIIEPRPKEKLFAKHVQCPAAYQLIEVRDDCVMDYAFDNEQDYYDDIAVSMYAITMKKAGWDCLRHYEIAANGTVPCFWNLSEKPKGSGPHGLRDMENVIAFKDAQELADKVKFIASNDLYPAIQANVLNWIRQNTCEEQARRLLSVQRDYWLTLGLWH